MTDLSKSVQVVNLVIFNYYCDKLIFYSKTTPKIKYYTPMIALKI